ncbi:MAG TPA: hypothetical protein V6C52_00790 [Coleofasciculaceae cyanobacterium]|jgi:hypothetical protein
MNRIFFGDASRRDIENAYLKQRYVQGKDRIAFLIDRLEVTESRPYPELPEGMDEVMVTGRTVGKDHGLRKMLKILFPKNNPDAVTDRLTISFPEKKNQ